MPDAPLRIIFAGTPEFASLHLKALIDSKHQLIAVYTQPDRPAGRGKQLQASPVKKVAQAAGLPLCQPASLRDAGVQQELADMAADLMIVVAYGLILPQPILDATRLGCLNVHASLLPRWRGAAPIQRAIEAGDNSTGITIMQMDAGLDTGAMLATLSCPIEDATTAATLHDALAELGPPLLLDVLGDIATYQDNAQLQDDNAATYAHKISKAEAHLDWSLAAGELDRKIRAFNPFPISFSTLEGERVRIWQAHPLDRDAPPAAPGTILEAGEEGILVSCGDGQLAIDALQLPGGKALDTAQILTARQAQFAPGKRFDPVVSQQS